MCLMISEMESSLNRLLSTLKKNRENVPSEILKSYYRQPYKALVTQINQLLVEYIRQLLSHKLLINPWVPMDIQAKVVNQAIDQSGLTKLRKKIEDALKPFIALQDCLVFNPVKLKQFPVIYNTITKKAYINGAWIDWQVDLRDKFVVYFRPTFRLKHSLMTS